MIDPAVLETVSVPLALEDAVPVLLSTAGFVVIARSIGRRMSLRFGRVALLGAVLIGLGGLAKVSWKVMAAGLERDVAGLDDLLFPLLSVGFLVLTLSMLETRRENEPTSRRANTIGLCGVAFAASLVSLASSNSGLSIRTAMIAAILCSLVFSWHLIQIANRNGLKRETVFLVVNVLGTLALAGLARAGEQTLGLQWIEQSINTVSQGLFLVAALRLAKGEVDWRRSDTTEARQPAPAA